MKLVGLRVPLVVDVGQPEALIEEVSRAILRFLQIRDSDDFLASPIPAAGLLLESRFAAEVVERLLNYVALTHGRS
jgi:hypothetical protein